MKEEKDEERSCRCRAGEVIPARAPTSGKLTAAAGNREHGDRRRDEQKEEDEEEEDGRGGGGDRGGEQEGQEGGCRKMEEGDSGLSSLQSPVLNI